MIYLITTQNDAKIPLSCLRENKNPDRTLLWEDSANIYGIDGITNDDEVIIAIKDPSLSDLVEMILEKNGLSKGSVIDFYKIFKAMVPYGRVDRVMNLPFDRPAEGIILGISHAEVGLLQDGFYVPFVNLAVSSQDLYYNLLSLRYVLEKYPQNLRPKHLIIDLYNYNYFNFDTSKGKLATAYSFLYGGIDWDEHNFSKNKNVTYSYDHYRSYIMQERYGGFDRECIEKFAAYFDLSLNRKERVLYYQGFPDIHLRTQVITDELIDLFREKNSKMRPRHEETIKENIKIFYDILELAREVNPDMTIDVLLMPYYEKAWHALTYNPYLDWKDEFEGIIRDAQKEYGFRYHDMIESDISNERICWYDAEHLNYYGAARFTRILNELLYRE